MADAPDMSFTELDLRATALIARFNEVNDRLVGLICEVFDAPDVPEVQDTADSAVMVYLFLRLEGMSSVLAEYGAVMSLLTSLAKVGSASGREDIARRAIDKIRALRSAS